MRIFAQVSGLEAALHAVGSTIADAATEAMRDATAGLKEELRAQVRAAGLPERLAKTWQGKVYPEKGTSIDPAGQVWSKAPTIISAFAKGATIVPIGGHPYLAIPTDNVPRGRGRGARKPMSVFEVELQFDQDLIIRRGKRGSILGFVDVLKAKNGRGFRRATSRRLAQGRRSKLVLMFVFVKSVRLAKRLDLDAAANRWAAQAAAGLSARLGG